MREETKDPVTGHSKVLIAPAAFAQPDAWMPHAPRNHSRERDTDLEPLEPSQPAHLLLVDALGVVEQYMHAPITVARVLGGQRLDLVDQRRIVRRVRGVVKGRPVDGHQLTGVLH